MTADTGKKADHALDQLVRDGEVPGIQHAVVGPEGIRYEGFSGVMDVLSGRPVSSGTTFMASSVTKTLTAAAVLQLHDRGRLDLDDPLGSCYPGHPYGDELRIVHLLNQSSGVPNPMPLRWLHLASQHDRFDEEDALRRVLKRHGKPRFKPGTRYAYSNLSYWLLGKVIESVSGMKYDRYMREQIFDPLGIPEESMGFVIPDKERHARGHLKKWSALGVLTPFMMDRDLYDRPGKGRRRFRPVYMNGPPYGGLIGTAGAFARFLQDQLEESPVLFSGAARERFFSDQTDGGGRPMETTLGWHKGRAGGTGFYGKPGGGPGYQSNIRVYPDRQMATVWLANEMAASEGQIHALTDRLDGIFL